MNRFCALLSLLCSLLLPACWLLPAAAQVQTTPDSAAVLRSLGLRSVNHQGSFRAAAYLPDGNLVLLFDQGDGLRVLKTDAAAATLLAEAHQGATGDAGVALTVDATGNVYVAGTSTSGALAGTPGARFAQPVDASTNGFVAKFDANLRLTFLSFLGADRTAVTGVSASANSVFVAGTSFGQTFPATPNALQPQPPGTNTAGGNGFVEAFSTDGSSLRYATFLNGADGASNLTAIAAAPDGSVFLAGDTTAASFPTQAALVPSLPGAVAGFLACLAPDGASLRFSTFLPGAGVSSLALDPSSGSLLLTADIASGQFPVAQVAAPVAGTPYQTLLRLSIDGQTLLSSVLLLPGTQSAVAAALDGTVWVTGSLEAPLDFTTEAHGPGEAFLLHVAHANPLAPGSAGDVVDQVFRLGGLVTNNPAYAVLSTSLASPAISPDGTVVSVAGAASVTTAPSLRPQQAFDLGLDPKASTLLNSAAQDLLPPSCADGQACEGSGGLLAQFQQGAALSAQTSLVLSSGDGSLITLRNPGPVAATGLSVTAAGGSLLGNCGATLPPFEQCALAVLGSGAASITVTAADAASVKVSVAALPSPAAPLIADTAALDFGIVTASSSPITRTVTVSNLSSTAQTFASQSDDLATAAPYTLAETGSTCAGPASAHQLAANASCTVTLGLSASTVSGDNGVVDAFWRLGTRDVHITGYTQASSLAVSTAAVDFASGGPGNGAALSRFVYLSNSSEAPVAHSFAFLPAGSPFSVLDGCPATLLAGSVCQLQIGYSPAGTPAVDSATLALDQGLSVLLTGQSLPSTVPATLLASPVSLSPTAVRFATAVPVSALSQEIQTVHVHNTSTAPLTLTSSVLGDFLLEDRGCGEPLAPGSTCALNLTFSPSQSGVRAGLLTVSAGPQTQPSTVALSGTGTALFPAPNGLLDLGETVVAEPTVSWLQIQGNFPQLTVGVTGPGFSVALLADDGHGHGTLPPGAFAPSATAPCVGCWLAVRFVPAQAGPANGTLSLSLSSDGHPSQTALVATAVPAMGLVLTPETLSFGAVPLGSVSAPASLVLTNLLPGALAATIQGVTVQGDFVLSPTNSGPGCAGLLQPTAACGLQIAFSPQKTGPQTGVLTLSTSAGDISATLMGTGVPPQANAGLPAMSATPSPQLSLFPTQADFGASPVGRVGPVRQFTLSNTGRTSTDLVLTPSPHFPLAATIGCAHLAAGASCSFAVAFVPGTGGALSGTVTVSLANDPTTQTVLYLRAYGTGTGTLTASGGTDPGTPLLFGSLPSGTAATQTVTLTNFGTAPLAVRRVTTTVPFAAAPGCTEAIAPGASCALTLTYTASNPLSSTGTQAAQTDRGTLTLETTTEDSPLTLYLSGAAFAGGPLAGAGAVSLPTYTLSPGSLTFPNTPAGASSPQQTVTVTNTGAVPVLFQAILPPTDITADTTCTELAPGATCLVHLSFRPAAQSPAPVVETVQLLSNAAHPVDLVTVLGASGGDGIQFGDSALRFGPVGLGATASAAITLTNTGTLPAQRGVFLIGGDFSLGSTDCPPPGGLLAAGQSCTATILFTPSAPGLRSATLTLSPASGPSQAPQLVALSGQGLAVILRQIVTGSTSARSNSAPQQPPRPSPSPTPARSPQASSHLPLPARQRQTSRSAHPAREVSRPGPPALCRSSSPPPRPVPGPPRSP